MASEDTKDTSDFSFGRSITRVGREAVERALKASRMSGLAHYLLLSLPQRVRSSPVIPQFSPSNETQVEADVQFLITLFNYYEWRGTVDWIRDTDSLDVCLNRLSIALSASGPLQNAETSGTAGALSLLPTAGALIGAPAKELWLVYKLMPVAGVLSMLLSLGGNIVPTQASDYNLNSKAFSYGGFIATTHTHDPALDMEDAAESDGSSAQKFARKVERRAKSDYGERIRGQMAIGIFIQLFWITMLIGACWFVQIGSVVVWWCKAWGWMLFWYLMVAFSSILENIAGVPFTHQWTIRVSKSPEVFISPDAPLVARSSYKPAQTPATPGDDMRSARYTAKGLSSAFSMAGYGRATNVEITPLTSRPTETDIPLDMPLLRAPTDATILTNLERGYNTTGTVVLDPNRPLNKPRVPLYVIISLEEVSTAHAALRVVSKAISVGVFAAGTSIFASSTLTTISVALTVLCLVLGAGVFGRVVSMWMASKLMKDNPIHHKVVKSREAAAEYIDEVLSLPGLTCEIMGHIIVSGRCICRYNTIFNWANIFGLLAAPFDITKLAVHRPRSLSKE